MHDFTRAGQMIMMTPFPQIDTDLIDALQVYLYFRIRNLPVSDDQKDNLTGYLRDIDSVKSSSEDFFNEDAYGRSYDNEILWSRYEIESSHVESN